MTSERLTGTDVKERVERRMNRIDALPKELRELVHEYGWAIVEAFVQNGVTSPKQIKRIVHQVMHDYAGR